MPARSRATASLAVLRRVEETTIGLQRRFDSFQDIALLQGQPVCSDTTQSTQEQVGYLQPQRRFGRGGYQQVLDLQPPVFVLFHIAHLSLRRAGLGPLLLRSESVDRAARTRPRPPRRAPTAVNGQATRRGKRAPSKEAPSSAPLAPTASTCSWVLKGAAPF